MNSISKRVVLSKGWGFDSGLRTAEARNIGALFLAKYSKSGSVGGFLLERVKNSGSYSIMVSNPVMVSLFDEAVTKTGIVSFKVKVFLAVLICIEEGRFNSAVELSEGEGLVPGKKRFFREVNESNKIQETSNKIKITMASFLWDLSQTIIRENRLGVEGGGTDAAEGVWF